MSAGKDWEFPWELSTPSYGLAAGALQCLVMPETPCL